MSVEPNGEGFALMALENQRLETELRASLRELRASRARILSAADRERRRIERDLHDGAQQRLVGLGIQLQLVSELVERDPGDAARRLRDLALDVDEAVDEVRSLAHGLVPPLLVERGLVDALRDVASSSPLAATVDAGELGRYGPEIESAVYFCCLEALQNAAKHAAGARYVTVLLREDEELRFEVRDDGAGLPDGSPEHGAGLTNMRDRIGAVGGRLTIESARGQGTRVVGSAPLAPTETPSQVEALLRRATDALEDPLAVYRALRDGRGEIADFRIEHVNEAACGAMGCSHDALVGRDLGELDPGFRESSDFAWLRRVVDDGVKASSTEPRHEVRAAPLGGGHVVVTWRVRRTPRARATASAGRRNGGPSS